MSTSSIVVNRSTYLHLGCILGEILLGKPLFQGTSTFNQLERILQHMPMPSPSDIASISSQYGPSVLERAGSGYLSHETSSRLIHVIDRNV
jgi:hypothetical protein